MGKPWEAYQSQQPGPWDAYRQPSPSPGLFDDLIPQRAAAGGGLFDDLIPQKPKAKAPGLVGGLARSFTEGVPVVGPAIRNASAALTAALAPSTDQFLEDES